MSVRSDDYDSPWKEILEKYFRDFLTFFFPMAAEEDRGGIGGLSLADENNQLNNQALVQFNWGAFPNAKNLLWSIISGPINLF